MRRNFLPVSTLFVVLVLGPAFVAAADKAPVRPATTKTGKSGKAAKSTKGRSRLSLMPALCVEQFITTEPHLNLAPSRASTNIESVSASENVVPLPRLGLQTDWGVVPFVGSALAPLAESPVRSSAAGGTLVPESAPFCDLDAGVSYNLGRSTNLNLGYSLPNSILNGVLGPLNDAVDAPAGKKVSIGIDIGF